MAFVEAKSTKYVNIKAADGITDIGIAITGYIKDDAWPHDYVGTYEISGADFAALPAQTLGEVPGDPRFETIKLMLAKFVKAKHAELSAAYADQVQHVDKPADAVAQLPTITPAILTQLP